MNKLYSNNKTKMIDQLAADYLHVDSFGLMQLAGAAIYQHVKNYSRILVITGPGNNGGDGFIVAEIARQQGQTVCVLALRDVESLQGDALLAAKQYQGELLTLGDIERCELIKFDVIVDAVFGTGLKQAVGEPYADVINWLNQQPAPVVAVDIPSGLNGDTGNVEGVAVNASKTIAILALNSGLFTSDGKDCCGEVLFEELGVPDSAYQEIDFKGQLLNANQLQVIPHKRQNNSHKGQFGHVIVAGGQVGMLGAVLLAGKAVLKSGAGSALIVTHTSHAKLLPLYLPELMSLGYDDQVSEPAWFEALNERRDGVLLLGMGLGQSAWSFKLYKNCIQMEMPLVLDADGLNLLARAATAPKLLSVITPHPKEAAMLLQSTVAEIQQDRWQAVVSLAQKYSCVVVLKGSGTLISDGENTWCCSYGNANLATAGSGDVLAGLVAGLIAQGFTPSDAAQLAVIWHAQVGEDSHFGLCMTASDLLNTLHEIWT